jgi:hypothetical protein
MAAPGSRRRAAAGRSAAVEVGREHPAVDQQHRRTVPTGVAQEELAAARDEHRATRRQRQRRDRRWQRTG